MKKRTKFFLTFLLVLAVIQFVRPDKNAGIADNENDIENTVVVSPEIKNILQKSCYDCHSDHTEYPWYFNFQPIAGWLAHHVEEGKQELNFSEFKSYKLRRKTHKLKEIIEQVKQGEMPMTSYTLIHKNAKLSPDETEKIIKWANESINILNDTFKK